MNKRVALLLIGTLILLVVATGCDSSTDAGGETETQQRAAALQRAQQQAAQRRALRRQVVLAQQARAQARRQAARRKAQLAAVRQQRAQERAEAAAEAEAAGATESSCDPNYSGACLDPSASDYDCEGGSGDGPYYTGTVTVVGSDPHGLDSDGDGIGCE